MGSFMGRAAPHSAFAIAVAALVTGLHSPDAHHAPQLQVDVICQLQGGNPKLPEMASYGNYHGLGFILARVPLLV